MSTEKVPRVVQLAEDSSEALRSLCHITGGPMPAPLLYDVLGNLKGSGYRLAQALQQMSSGLGLSLDKYDVYDGEGRDPVQSVATAVDHLTRAGQLATQLGQELDLAQSAINMQGYRQAEQAD